MLDWMVIYNWGQKSFFFIYYAFQDLFSIAHRMSFWIKIQNGKISTFFLLLFCSLSTEKWDYQIIMHNILEVVTGKTKRSNDQILLVKVANNLTGGGCWVKPLFTSFMLNHTFTQHSFHLKIVHTVPYLYYWQFAQLYLRSSSKYVSLPSAPGTEQIRRVFRNVVHLFTRLRWPPISFWLQKK